MKKRAPLTPDEVALRVAWREASNERRTKLRDERKAAFGGRYLPAGAAGACCYCGQAVGLQQVDHVPPLAVVEKWADLVPLRVVPCCGDCNRDLGASQVLCLVARARLIYRRISAAFRRGKPDGLRRRDLVVARGFAGEIRDICQCAECRPANKALDAKVIQSESPGL